MHNRQAGASARRHMRLQPRGLPDRPIRHKNEFSDPDKDKPQEKSWSPVACPCLSRCLHFFRRLASARLPVDLLPPPLLGQDPRAA